MSESAWTKTARLVDSTTEPNACAEQEEVMRLFGELRVPLLRYLHGLGLPPGDGEDIVQDAFLALFRHLRDGKPRDNLSAWVFRVARNLALKRIQQESRPARAGEAWDDLPDPAPNPEQQAALNQQERTTRAVVGALPPLDRQCLQLRAAGLRYREIAEVLDISLGAVAANVSRALSRIARANSPEK